MKLTMLKPRLATAKTSATQHVVTSWRHSGMTSAQRGYGYQWQKARAKFLHENPLCVYCEREGRITAATVVDHIEPHRGNQELFWDKNNWQSLCAHCHNSVKAKEEANSL